MDSLKKLQAKVTQLKQSATNLTHKKSLSTSSKKSHDKTVRHSRSMPLDPVSLEPEVWIAQPRAQYKGKTPLKTSDIRVITRPQDQKIPPYAPLMVRDVEPEEEEYSDEDWYAGPTPPPKDIVYLFPAPPKTIPKPTSKEPSPRPSTKQVSPKPVVPVPTPVSSPPRIPKPVDSPLHKEDLLPPPPKAMFDKMQRQAERRRPKNPLGPLQTAPSWEEVEDFVMRSEPSSRPTSPQVDLDRDRLREALRRRKTQANHRQRPGHLPTPSSSSAGSVTTAPLEIRRTRSTGASAALSPRSKGTAGDGDPSTQGTETAMTRNYSDTTSTPPLRVGASRKVDHDTPGFDVFGPTGTGMSTPLLLRPLSPPASPPSSPPPSFNSTHRRAQTTERIQLKEVKHYQGFGGTQPESPGPRYKLDSSSSSIILDRSTSSSGRSSATRSMRHYPTPSNSSGSSFCSSGDYQRDASSSSVLPPSPPPKKKVGLPLGAHTMSSAYRSAVPDIGFMSPADRVATTTTVGASTVSHRRANTADRLPLTRRF